MDTEQEQPSVIRQEIGRQAVILVFGVAGAAIMIWLQHHQRTATADDWALLRMRAARHTERAAATAAQRCWRVAERARLAYERERA